MYSPESFAALLGLMAVSMLCWSSWANTFSAARGEFRFELFYWDYAVGILLGALALAAVLSPQSAVFHGSMDVGNVAWAIASGAVFSIGCFLLVAAISLIVMTVAFPVSIGLALLIGSGVSWCIEAAVPARHLDRLHLLMDTYTNRRRHARQLADAEAQGQPEPEPTS